MNMSMYIDGDAADEIYKEKVNIYLPEFINKFHYTPWVFSVIGSCIIGLSGILPLAIVPTIGTTKQNSENFAESKTLKLLLSFAVGGLLGDVFLHLLPETWAGDSYYSSRNNNSVGSGLWVLSGVLMFTIIEKLFSGYVNVDENNPQPKCVEIATCLLRTFDGKFPSSEDLNKIDCSATKSCDIEDIPNACYIKSRQETAREQPRRVAGYLNLMANSIDNFTHGLAVGGSFLVSFRHGVLATFAILVHEIPHEVGDFAILLRSGFNRWDAARAQLLTASAGLLGALVAICGSGVKSALEAKTSWITPFTAGGFLHIALVAVLPDLVKEEQPRESVRQFISLIFGITSIIVVTLLFDT